MISLCPHKTLCLCKKKKPSFCCFIATKIEKKQQQQVEDEGILWLCDFSPVVFAMKQKR